ncbi:RNA polymerase sigma-70 factor [Agriterribacter sp.]|uniref:RNA polymerase sigma factor n=1 Tax=Agriterribacter sp. TaxID=2821509 RepID=UPI002C248AB3|nr:RNA polymerase sigma-70 factor [Agriterribacter sp.]HTN06841.1 RNA polymerase sigma-70 factor [Agriterribacter sp.]
MMTEKQILCQVSEGNEIAFRQLYEKYKDQVYYISFKFFKSQSIAEDVLQEVFLKIWMHKEKLSVIDSFSAYLTVILRNHIYNRFRKLANEEVFIRKAAATQVEHHNYTLDNVLLNESRNLLTKAIEKLPPQQKKAFELSRIEGKKHEEIARLMNISKETVKKHVMEASRTLKRIFYFRNTTLLSWFLLLLLLLSSEK